MDMDEVDPDPSDKGFLPKEARRRDRIAIGNNVVLRKIKSKNVLQELQPTWAQNATKEVNEADHSKYSNIKQWINSSDLELQLQGLKAARQCKRAIRAVLHDHNTALLNMGILPACIKFLMSGNNKLISETTWLLSNIAAGNESHTEHLINSGVIQPVILLLKSSEPDIVEHCVRTLGNCMAENEEIRMKILNMRVIPPLVEVIKQFRNHIINMRTLAFTFVQASKINLKYDSFEMFNLPPSVFQTEQILLAVQTLILLNDSDVQSATCWVIFYVSCNASNGVESVLRAGLLPKLMFLLASNDEEVVVPCLKAIGNIAAIKTQIDQLIKYGILISLAPFLKSSNMEIVYLSAWVLSCISEGSEDHLKEILESCVLDEIIAVIEYASCGMHIKKECLFIIKNLAGTTEVKNSLLVLEKIIKNRLMEIIVHCLKVKDTSVIEISLLTLENMFLLSTKNKGRHRLLLTQLEENDGIDELENLAYHLNPVISKKSCEILEEYFPDGVDNSSDSSSDYSPSRDGAREYDSSDENENHQSKDDLDIGIYL